MDSCFALHARWVTAVLLAALAACGDGGPGVTDHEAPEVVLTAPAHLAVGLTGLLTVSAHATDNVGVIRIELEVDGQGVGGNSSSTGHAAPHSVDVSALVDTSAYAPGQHVVRARARDEAGHTTLTTATVSFGGSSTQPAGFTRSDLVTGLSSATAFAQAPDGRFFVATQGGALRIVKNGVLLGAPFLTLAVDANGERGLIGVALHPDFAVNGWVYVYATTPEGGTHNRISRYRADPARPDTVLAGSEWRIADLPVLSGATNHNGGALQFGLDGKLYVGVGDNADGSRAPDLSQVFGKVLRLNDDGSIPVDNPVCTTPGLQTCAIWARGLRNPFTLALQPGSGRLHINDVGELSWEEIDLGVPAADYGWPATEGPTTAAGVTAPLFAYPHSATNPPGAGPGGFFSGCAIVGGAFYPDSGNFPAAYRGSYFFSDFCAGFVGRIDLAHDNAAYAFGQVTGSPVGLRVGLDGALLVLTQSAIVRFSVP